MRARLATTIGEQSELSIPLQLLTGSFAALIAVVVRLELPLLPQQLPTLTLVIAVAVITTFVGLWAGLSTAVVGAILTWTLLWKPSSWDFANGAWVPLLGFAVISTTIVSTSALYRSSERRRQALLIDEAEKKTADAVLFAREMAHRLKNALAIVQSMAFQTIGSDDARSQAFSARLRTLADANELLTEHISKPVASVKDVVGASLAPFEREAQLRCELPDASLPDSQVISLALALHELATNAIKYGAWSSPTGTVRLVVQDEGAMLRLRWIEEGGPTVKAPSGSGFGTRLLGRAGQGAVLRYAPGGFYYEVELRRVT